MSDADWIHASKSKYRWEIANAALKLAKDEYAAVRSNYKKISIHDFRAKNIMENIDVKIARDQLKTQHIEKLKVLKNKIKDMEFTVKEMANDFIDSIPI